MGHVACMGVNKIVYRVWCGNLKERDLGCRQEENIEVDLEERHRQVSGFCEYGNEPSGSIPWLAGVLLTP